MHLTSYLRVSCGIIAGVLFFYSNARAETVEEFLNAFYADPARMMQRLPSEVDSSGVAHPRGLIDETQVEERINARLEFRDEIMARAPKLWTAAPPPAGPEERDNAEILIDPGTVIVRNLAEMQARGLMNINAPVIPWADSYWPKYKGEIGARYADAAFPNSKSFDVNYQYSLSNPAVNIVNSGNSALIDTLSPSEKYDFVLGDMDFTLTKYAWNEGRRARDESGGVGSWEGICHGWSGAAHLLRPFNERPLVVQSQSGVPVTFYPQDMKALITMLWANAHAPTRFVGNRCAISRPPKNSYGRIIDKKCFDPNPATWHIGLVNQLGINRRSFVIDATYDFQVWNHPVTNARYRYFNLNTRQEADSLQSAAVPLSGLRIDYFREFRSQAAKYVVGVAMDLTYVIEIEPGQRRVFETPTKTIRLIYDLELDESYNIVGGEWYSNAHPDFLWTYNANAQPMAREDSQLLNDIWNNSGPVPFQWAQHAQRASARGEPLYSFIKKVLDAGGYTEYTGPKP